MTASFFTVTLILALACLAGIASVTVFGALRLGARREDSLALQAPVAASRFTIPVSIILPVENPDTLLHAIRMLMDLTYPEFEVIVVAGHLEGAFLERLSSEWDLVAKEFFYRHTIETAPVHRIYRSNFDPRLTVVSKGSAGRADALNCGVDLARFRYVCTVSDDVNVEADALLRVMSPALWDPANVLGVSSHVERRLEGSRPGGEARDRTTPRRGLLTRIAAPYQHLASLRSLMDSRLVWRQLSGGLGPYDHVAVWRRDAVVQLGGFSTTAADPSFDMMARLQTADPSRIPGHVFRSAEVFARGEPLSVRQAFRRGANRQRAVIETWRATRRVAGAAPRARRDQDKLLAYFVTTELIVPFLQAWVTAVTVVGAAVGWLSWSHAVLAIVLLSFGNATVSGAALFLRAAAPGAPDEIDLKRMLLTAPLEFVLYRPVLAFARFAALGGK